MLEDQITPFTLNGLRQDDFVNSEACILEDSINFECLEAWVFKTHHHIQLPYYSLWFPLSLYSFRLKVLNIIGNVKYFYFMFVFVQWHALPLRDPVGMRFAGEKDKRPRPYPSIEVPNFL